MDHCVRFDRYRFDFQTGQLWSGNAEVRLTPKASDVLKALVAHAGRPVSKDDLFASVWNGTSRSCAGRSTMTPGNRVSSKRVIAAATSSSPRFRLRDDPRFKTLLAKLT
jgi:Transcriptional regulatory protein, C terminal